MNDTLKFTCMSFLLRVKQYHISGSFLCIFYAFIFQIYNRGKLLPKTAADTGWMGNKVTA